MATVNVVRSYRRGVVGVHHGKSVESIGRRLFGRSTQVSYSADPHSPTHGMYVQRLSDGSAWNILGEFRVWER